MDRIERKAFDLISQYIQIFEQLIPIVVLKNTNSLKNVDKDKYGIMTAKYELFRLESVILSTGLQYYKNFEKELYRQKEQIDFLDEQANHKTSNQLLIDVASTKKNMVMLEHTLDVQERAFSQLLNDENFLR
ncbi:Uncharacterised protein [Aerococcus viridans]|nr:Uncharacterised protein [Aerococcus viridans]